MQPQGQRPPDNGTTVATTASGLQGALPSSRDAVIPMHPFSGLLSVAVEQNWRVEEIFRGFEFDHSGQPLPGQRINFLQAREIVLRASHRGGARTAALSGSRKSLANLGVIGLGILAHASLGEGLNFGVEFQRLSGSMLDVRVQAQGDEVSLVAGDLFGDDETRSFLQTDHLLTAVNALTHLRTRGFGVRRIELEGELPADLVARLEHEFGCPVGGHAEVARAVFDAGHLAAQLPYNDSATAALARQVCERELEALGLAPSAPGLRAHVLDPRERVRSPAAMAAQLGVSTRTLHRMFAAEGLKYADVAQQLRVERARRLLAHGMSTEQVAIELDYSDARSFRRAFEQWTGESPAQLPQTAVTGLLSCAAA